MRKGALGRLSLTGLNACHPPPGQPFYSPPPPQAGPWHSQGLPGPVPLESTRATSTSFLCPGTPRWPEAMHCNAGLQDFL